jgi:DNA mismatch endonuclease (patch repair protein)
MSRQATRDTDPEARIRRRLHADGLRYRVHVRPLPQLRRTADIVFTRRRVAVFVDGCFWHGCPVHATKPKRNAEWWAAKIEANVKRDAETDRLLEGAGWVVVRVWEHEDPQVAASRIRSVVTTRTTGSHPNRAPATRG